MRNRLTIPANIYRRRKSYFDRNFRAMLEGGLLPKEKCTKCGTRKELEYHHIKHLEHGGRNEVENIVVLCHSCHEHRHSAEMRA